MAQHVFSAKHGVVELDTKQVTSKVEFLEIKGLDGKVLKLQKNEVQDLFDKYNALANPAPVEPEKPVEVKPLTVAKYEKLSDEEKTKYEYDEATKKFKLKG